MTDTGDVVGVILAGGRASRMGGTDKSFIELAGKPLIARTIARFGPQVGHMSISANGDPARFGDFGLPVLADPVVGFAGPLAGILAALEWARASFPSVRWLASTSVDTPFLPLDLVARLKEAQAIEHAEVACARSDGRLHPVCGLWRIDLAADLRRALLDEGLHKVDAWARRHRMANVEFPSEPFDPFFNINRAEDLTRAETLLASYNGTPA